MWLREIRVRFYREWPRFAALAAFAYRIWPRFAAFASTAFGRASPRFASTALAANYRFAAFRL